MTNNYIAVKDIYQNPEIALSLPNLGHIVLNASDAETGESVLILVLFDYASTHKTFHQLNPKQVENNKVVGAMKIDKNFLIDDQSPIKKALNNLGYSIINLGVKQ